MIYIKQPIKILLYMFRKQVLTLIYNDNMTDRYYNLQQITQTIINHQSSFNSLKNKFLVKYIFLEESSKIF